MDNDFQPWYEEKNTEAFDIWNLKASEAEPVLEIDEHEEFLKECERLRTEAKKRGYQEGWQEADAQIKQKQQELTHWIDFLQKPLAMLDDELSKEVMQTILWVCEACIGIELSIHAEKLSALMDAIKLELPALQGNKQLAMHPADVEAIGNSLKIAKDSYLLQILVADPTLQRGDFYIKGEYTELDGRLKTRLQKILKSYLQADETTDVLKPKEFE